MLVPSISRGQKTESLTFLAGSGGVPGGRETGEWVRDNIPEGAVLMAIGPSMGSIIRFYGRKQALGLSVSPNAANRNPSYDPIINPDLRIRSGDIQYVVWDGFSAARSTHFSSEILRYSDAYHGRQVYRYSVEEDGELLPMFRQAGRERAQPHPLRRPPRPRPSCNVPRHIGGAPTVPAGGRPDLASSGTKRSASGIVTLPYAESASHSSAPMDA